MCQSHLEDFRGRWAVSFAASPSAGGWVERTQPSSAGVDLDLRLFGFGRKHGELCYHGCLGSRNLWGWDHWSSLMCILIGSSLCHSMFFGALNLQVFHFPFKWYAVDTDAVSDGFSFTDLDGFGPLRPFLLCWNFGISKRTGCHIKGRQSHQSFYWFLQKSLPYCILYAHMWHMYIVYVYCICK